MKKIFSFNICVFCLLLITLAVSYAQKVETIDGIRVVHNGKDGKWGKNPKVSLQFVKTIGSLDTEDENLSFYMPSDIAIDNQGNVHVLDSGNHRIQKFDPDGQYITTIGRKGQGPAEFYFPISIDIDPKGYLYISDSGNQRIQILKPDGTDHKTVTMVKDPIGVSRISDSGNIIMGSGGGFFSFGPGTMMDDQSLPKLIKVVNSEGDIQKDFGDKLDYKDFLMNRMGNTIHFTVDKNNNAYIAFDYQNRIEKYSPNGKLLWKSDRKLNYNPTPPKKKSGFMKRRGGMVEIQQPQMNRCSGGIAVDDKGRAWVVALKRQIKEDEQVQTNVRASRGPGGERAMSVSVLGNTDVKETDMYLLEVYDPDGILLGRIQLNQFVDDIRIDKDRLFLLDKMRGMQYYEYKIIEK